MISSPSPRLPRLRFLVCFAPCIDVVLLRWREPTVGVFGLEKGVVEDPALAAASAGVPGAIGMGCNCTCDGTGAGIAAVRPAEGGANGLGAMAVEFDGSPCCSRVSVEVPGLGICWEVCGGFDVI